MKKFLIASTALVAFAAGAQAADLGAPRMPIAAAVVAPAFNWTGFYVGGHVGWGWQRSSYLAGVNGTAFLDYAAGDRFAANGSGFIGGVQVGYNWQAASNFVFGVEASLSGTSISRSFTPALGAADDVYRASLPIYGTLTGRLGVAADRALFYVKGGLAAGSVRHAISDVVPANVGAYTTTSTRVGWTLGAGLEYAFTPNWTAGLEYNYVDLGRFTAGSGAGDSIRVATQVHTVTLKLNYLFSTGPSAVVARY